MSPAFDVTRRRVLAAGVALAASSIVGLRAMTLIIEQLAAPETPADRLRGIVAHRDSAALFGRAYLRQSRHEGSATRLVELILEGAQDLGDLRRHVASRIQADFGADDTVIVEGWVVSRTEARLCALCALG